MKIFSIILGLLLGLSIRIGGQSIKKYKIEHGSEKSLVGTNVTLVCQGIGSQLQWQHHKHLILDDDKRFILEELKEEGSLSSRLHLTNVSLKDSGRYKCIIKKDEKKVEKNISLHFQMSPIIEEIKNYTGINGSPAELSCTGKGVPNPTVHWSKGDDPITPDERYSISNESSKSPLHTSLLIIKNIDETDAGNYVCQFENSHGKAIRTTTLNIQELPEIELLTARSLGPNEIQLHWKINKHGAPLSYIKIYIVKESVEEELIIDVEDVSTSWIVLGKKDLDIMEHPEGELPSLYQVLVETSNVAGPVSSEVANITMLTRKPYFRPVSSLRGSTKDSLTVRWTQPDDEIKEYIDFFELTLTNNKTGDVVQQVKDSSSFDNLFTQLNDGTKYIFTVSACLKFPDESKECGPSSRIVSGRTMAQPPAAVSDILVRCFSNRTSGINVVSMQWVPSTDDKEFNSFKIELKASANFINHEGRSDYYNNLTVIIVEGDQRNYTFDNVQPNTNYTVKIYAGNNHVLSSAITANCQTPFWVPSSRSYRWWKSKVDERVALKLPTPSVSQRNGTICCHRIVVVRLALKQLVNDLPLPIDIPLTSYYSVQNEALLGGYVAEAFSGRSITSKYLYIGDGEVNGNWSSDCAQCLGIEDPTVSATREKLSEGLLPYTQEMRRRSPEVSPMAEDGYLNKEFNYTGFHIMSVRDRNGTVLSSFSALFNPIMPIEELNHVQPKTTRSTLTWNLVNVILVLGALITILALMAMVLAILLCHYHKRRKQLLEDGIDQSLTGSLGRSHTLMSQPGIDVKPIPIDELVQEYLEKIKDSELGFRREFEALPEKFYDRSSRASEMSENSCKNRYPDIKAYDQTRVKLSQVNGLVSSNYINANYVMGYKERKKFICAQGPMEATVNDFWRMIVEQRSSLCIMLTNLEETGKVKCVKYWPEAGEPKTFGNITVRLVKEKPYADYMVRTLRAEWTVTTTSSSKDSGNSTNTTSAENGGTGTIKSNSSNNSNSVSSNSVTTSEETKFHEVQQYHYLVWKDFVAPEHPVGLLSFLRRINEAYSTDLGPLLVHCSAGVGRTGTLVALDSLVTELDEEGQASIYNLICDLRHQRNFLVQSLKQYVFVHRALMEHAQFGNSEQSISKLKENYVKHTNHSNSEETPELEKEFKRLSRVIEDRKAFTVANSDWNKTKNRYDYVLPYDTNCVILTPLPNQIGATYINASFVAGFDLGENFIISQDPLENTISDFWRMTYEQEVNTIVMLSELGSGEDCCSKYWPDDEEVHEYVTVKFVSSESYPKFTTRTFLITNNKNSDTRTVTQFQYVGWSGLVGEVPLATLGIMEVITRVQSHNDINPSHLSPTIVHCSGGGDRSSVYICLNNCLRQFRRESCVDVFQTARKIRAQRQFQLQEFAQYEFVYKALVEYIDVKRGENL